MTSGITSSAIGPWSMLCSADSAITATPCASMDHRCAILKAETREAIVETKQDYIRKVLDAYRHTPGTTGVVHRNDRLLAAALYDRGVPRLAIENALLLAAARRVG